MPEPVEPAQQPEKQTEKQAGPARECVPYICDHGRTPATTQEVLAALTGRTMPISAFAVAVAVARARGCDFPRTNMSRRGVIRALNELSATDGTVTWAAGTPEEHLAAFAVAPPDFEPERYLREETYWMLTSAAHKLRTRVDAERAVITLLEAAADSANDALESLGLPRSAIADPPGVSVRLKPFQWQALLAAATRRTGGAWLIPADLPAEQPDEQPGEKADEQPGEKADERPDEKAREEG